MTIEPINVDAVTAAVQQLWRDDPNLGIAGTEVSRYEEISNQPGALGWVGIYRERVDYPIRALGMGSGFRNQSIRLVAIACESDSSSGEECGQRLDALVQKLIGSLLTDASLGGTVTTLDEFSVVYFDYSRNEDTGRFLQYAQINFTGVNPVTVR